MRGSTAGGADDDGYVGVVKRRHLDREGKLYEQVSGMRNHFVV